MATSFNSVLIIIRKIFPTYYNEDFIYSFFFNKATASFKFSMRTKGKWFGVSGARSVQKVVVSGVSTARPRGTQGHEAR